MYRLADPVTIISGIGPSVAKKLAEVGIATVQDLALYLPFRYEDLSNIVTIDQLLVGETATLKATVLSASSSWRGRRKMTRATIGDETGKVRCIWFNNRFVEQKLKKGEELFFSGKYTDKKMLVQPAVERASADTSDNIHTGRLVPIYSKLNNDIPMGSLRRWLKNVVDNLKKSKLPQQEFFPPELPDLVTALKILHFPDDLETVIPARESLALEEMLGLIRHSQKIKQDWKNKHQAIPVSIRPNELDKIPGKIPFALTDAQIRSTQEILSDIQNDVAMNRLLVGDVGSGKTVVAGIAAFHVLKNKHSAVIVAPTQILAKQHQETFNKLFPSLKTQIVTTKNSKKITKELVENKLEPTLFIGTHAVLNKLELINPALIIYDEQHRFGVSQRTSPITSHGFTPHILTMTATPIPRSLMLTLFSHLQLSSIDEMPPGRKPTQTWLIPKSKRESSLEWLAEEIQKTKGQAMVVCPFIEPSKKENFSNVAAATDLFKELEKFYAKFLGKGAKTASHLNLGLLHGRLPAKQKEQVITDLFAKKINLLVTTPVVEVGVDLPKANIIIIEAAERFGLASLHQLRGRVGRAGQKSYCLLFTNSKNPDTKNRLKLFTKENNGLKLAEKDLENRGAGELFGFRQSGFSDLRFASWANLELIQSAHQIHTELEKNKTKWQPLIKFETKNDNPGNN